MMETEIKTGNRYIDCGYQADVPRGATRQAPEAKVWRRTITVSDAQTVGSSFVPVVARWEYLTSELAGKSKSTWIVATERRLQVPATSLGNRFQAIEN